MKAYSEDLRKKIVEALERGAPKTGAARLFGVSLSSVKRYARIACQGGSLVPKKGSGRPRQIGEEVEKLLEEDAEERPSATISDRRRFLERLTAKTLSDSTVRRLLRRLGFSRKKRTVGAMERDEWLRAAWRVMIVGKVDPERLVFVDEMVGANVSLFPLSTLGHPRANGRMPGCRVTGAGTPPC
jgi:transposase